MKNTKKNLLDKLKSFRATAQGLPLLHHIVIVFLSGILGIIFFFWVNAFVLPEALPLPKTTAINWLTIQKHSLTLDYIRFFTFFVITSLSIIGGWVFYIWKKGN